MDALTYIMKNLPNHKHDVGYDGIRAHEMVFHALAKLHVNL